MSGMLKDILKPKDVSQIMDDVGNQYTLTKFIIEEIDVDGFFREYNEELILSILNVVEFPSTLQKVFEAACKKGKEKIVKIIIDKNIINPAENNNFGLRQAYSNNRFSVVRLLIENQKVKDNLSSQQLTHLKSYLEPPYTF
jgi:hypothetical protein